MRDTHARSVWKAVSYRISSSIVTAILIYIFTGEIKISAYIGGIDATIKLIWYYLHERLWNQSDWGRNHSKHKKKEKNNFLSI